MTLRTTNVSTAVATTSPCRTAAVQEDMDGDSPVNCAQKKGQVKLIHGIIPK